MLRNFSLLKYARDFIEREKSNNPQSYIAAKISVGGILILDALFGLENPIDGKDKKDSLVSNIIMIIFVSIFLSMLSPIIDIDGGRKDRDSTTIGIVDNVVSHDSSDNSHVCSITYSYTVDDLSYTDTPQLRSDSFCDYSTGAEIEINYDSTNIANSGLAKDSNYSFLSAVRAIIILVLVLSIISLITKILQLILGGFLIYTGNKERKELLPDGFKFDELKTEMSERFGSIAQGAKRFDFKKILSSNNPNLNNENNNDIVFNDNMRDNDFLLDEYFNNDDNTIHYKRTLDNEHNDNSMHNVNNDNDNESTSYEEYLEFLEWKKKNN